MGLGREKERVDREQLKRRYSKPVLTKVLLIPEEGVVLGCWNCGSSSGGSC